MLYLLHIFADDFEFLGMYNTSRPYDRQQLCQDVQAADKGLFVPTSRDISQPNYQYLSTLKTVSHDRLLTLNNGGSNKW